MIHTVYQLRLFVDIIICRQWKKLIWLDRWARFSLGISEASLQSPLLMNALEILQFYMKASNFMLWIPIRHWGIYSHVISHGLTTTLTHWLGDTLKFLHNGSMDENSALVQAMAWLQIGNKPLPEPGSMLAFWQYCTLPKGIIEFIWVLIVLFEEMSQISLKGGSQVYMRKNSHTISATNVITQIFHSILIY